jgi:hypothetical protein
VEQTLLTIVLAPLCGRDRRRGCSAAGSAALGAHTVTILGVAMSFALSPRC